MGNPNQKAAIRAKALKARIGKTFGRLLVLAEADKSSPLRLRCKCACGNYVTIRSMNIAKAQSCGCYRSEYLRAKATKHGMSGTPTYAVWATMVQRCTNPRNKDYADYGGRGIEVSDRWLKFANFFADLGEIPRGLTIERKENSKGYEPGNVVFATWTEQAYNRRPKGQGRKAREAK